MKDQFFVTTEGVIAATNIVEAAIEEIEGVASFAVIRVLNNSLVGEWMNIDSMLTYWGVWHRKLLDHDGLGYGNSTIESEIMQYGGLYGGQSEAVQNPGRGDRFG
ncbi:hypothetical protein [Solemya elarraichensis gill symbiont]|uniref:Uncharacterized protein n=1 Tax=Solemya elarraichensis gill symbiont TaxID=1918949 RepID=A0A1T2L0H8_9GAMM|nr:hypothetical protein [Solemya elarraichensis gill symbiont]OOZ38613.1 hypothetical protein BOW52_08280 [Solemya elarraichensis gill symbiont]